MLTKEYAKPHTMRLVVNAVVKMTATTARPSSSGAS